MTGCPQILPGSTGEASSAPTLGVLGGGQLAQMFVHAAQSMGYRTAVLDPEENSPAGAVAHRHVRAQFLEAAGLDEMASVCDALTTEFENVPADTLAVLGRKRPVAPSAASVAVCQHRGREKAHFQRAGVACAPYALLQSAEDALRIEATLFPGILKTCTLGYDGKGQVVVDSPGALLSAWHALGAVSCVLEQRVDLQLELSVVVARGFDGQMVSLPPQQNLHRAGILYMTQVPAPDVSEALATQAVQMARTVADSLAYVGVLCVEFFLLRDGRLLVNEMAPRPHNSGHYSIDACDVSQFELQVRTLAGLPLAEPRQHSPAVMLNLLGDLWFPQGSTQAPVSPHWDLVLALPGSHLHLYGKRDARPGRKMGHLTVTAADARSAMCVARQAADILGMAPI